MDREISIEELFDGADVSQGIDFIESLRRYYDYGYEKLGKNMNSRQMRAYQDYLYSGNTDDWD